MASINIAASLLLSLFLFVTVPPCVLSQLSVQEAKQIEQSVALAQTLVDNLAQGKYTASITSIAKTIGPYLGTIAPMLGLVLAILPAAPSVEVQLLKQLQKSLDNGFKRVDMKLDKVIRAIDWSQFNIRFGEIEGDIRSNLRYLSTFENSPDESINTRKIDFIRHYEVSYKDAGGKLFDAIVNTNQVFSSNIPKAVMRYTQYNRKQFRDTMCGMMSLLLACSRLEMSYYFMKNATSVMKEQQQLWVGRMNKVDEVIRDFDKQVTNEYHTQSGKDIDKVAADNEGKSNKDFSGILLKFLSTKFPWRNWFIVIYDAISGGDNHWVRTCRGYLKFRKFGRNIVVASEPVGDARTLLVDHSKKWLSGIPETKSTGWFTNKKTVKLSAKVIYDKNVGRSNCAPAPIFGVVKRYSDLWCAPGNKCSIVSKKYYNIFEVG